MKYTDYKTKTKLILPFEGEWLVSNGGRDHSKNNHLAPDGQGEISQAYAYDFIKGCKGSGERLEDYEAYGAEIIAPADGIVVAVISGSSDVPIGDTDWVVLTGNSIVLDHENGEWSVLAHLKFGSIKVTVGERVNQGDLLALCGNSGNTTEPHLHYHLQDGQFMYKAHGLPASFQVLINGEVKENVELEGDQKVSNLSS